jgi:hypothetical protein
MWHLIYSIRNSVVPINSLLLTVTLYYSVKTTPIYNDTKYSVPFMMLWLSSTGLYLFYCMKTHSEVLTDSPTDGPNETHERQFTLDERQTECVSAEF